MKRLSQAQCDVKKGTEQDSMTLSAAEGILELLTSPVHILSGLSYTFAYPTTFSDFYTMLNRKPTIYCWSIDCCGI